MAELVVDNRSQTASFDVDCQNTFTPLCPDELPVPEGDMIVAQLNAQAKKAAFRLGSKDAHSQKAVWIADHDHPQFSPIEGNNVDMRWVPHAIVGSKGFASIDGLPAVTEYDYFVWKGIELDMHPYGACFHDFAERLSTGVIEFLRAKNVTTVIVGGLATDYCVKKTVLQLCQANFRVIVNLAACRAIHPDTEQTAIQDMTNAGAVMVASADHIQLKA